MMPTSKEAMKLKRVLSAAVTTLGLSSTANFVDAQDWIVANAPNDQWVSITCSADGARLAAVSAWGALCTSTDFGAAWVSNRPDAGDPAHAPNHESCSFPKAEGRSSVIVHETDREGPTASIRSSGPTAPPM